MSLPIDNNCNDNLDDVIEVLQKLEGHLTDSDRRIPKEDVDQIRNAAWSIPVPKTENVRKCPKRSNNHVEETEETEEKPSKNKDAALRLKMRRRRSERSATTAPFPTGSPRRSTRSAGVPNLHYTYHEDIASGMNQMSMSRHVTRTPRGDQNEDVREEVKQEAEEDEEEEDDDDEEEEEEEDEDVSGRSSESSSSGSSDSDEYLPAGPSSIDNNTNQSDSPRRTGRLRKEQKVKMTSKELEERRKEANKTNSKRYNRNKKAQEKELTEDVVEKEGRIEASRRKDRDTHSKILACYECIREVIDLQMNTIPPFPSQEGYLQTMESVEKTSGEAMKKDNHLRKLEQKWREKRKAFQLAANDLKTKRQNTNTYGSRKSRALHTMNIAELAWKSAKADHRIRHFSRKTRMTNDLKKQLAAVLQWRYVKVSEIFPAMSPARTAQIDQLIHFLAS